MKKQSAPAPIASRPRMPGYGIVAAAEGQGLLPWSWAVARMRKTRNCWLSTVRPGPRPHAMPIWGVWHEGAFYFSTGRRSVKARNLARNPRCVVCFDDRRQQLVLEGAARRVTSRARIRAAGVPYRKKYALALDPKLGPVFAVRPRRAFAFTEDAHFYSTATRWRFP